MNSNKKNTYIGLDVGTKTIGISTGIPSQGMAFPFELYNRKSFEKDILYIVKICMEESATKIVVGHPKNMNGSIGPQAEYVDGFVEKLKENTKIPIFYWDERLSTSAVEKFMISADVSRKKRKKVIDAQAATFILQGFIDHEKSTMRNISS